METKQLKRKVLSLALMGHLVPQNPTDEPAIELLKRINPKFTPPEYDNPLPQGWSVATIKDICTTINGLWNGKKGPFINVGVLRNANFTKDFKLDFSNIKYLNVEANSFKKRNLVKGDLIVEKSGGSDKSAVGRAVLYEAEDGKYSFSNFTMLMRIKNKNDIQPKYLYYFLMSAYLSGAMFEMENHTTGLHNLIIDKYLSFPIPLPPLAEQKRIVERIEEIFKNIDNIREGKETLRDVVKKMRRKILSTAISGGLVPQNPADEPAIELLRRINPKFTPPEYDNPLPQGWSVATIKDICTIISSRPYQILQSQIKKKGKYPVVSQSADINNGYSDAECALIHNKPYIIFGDHTRNVKYVDFDFIVGADGVKIIDPLIDNRFAYFLIMHIASCIRDRGYERHFSLVSKFVCSIPPLAEQKRIVEKIEKLFAVLDSMEVTQTSQGQDSNA